MTETLVRRVANALMHELAEMYRSDISPALGRNPEALATAVLKAMREPTESMISAGSTESRTGGNLIGDGRLVMIWQAMIDQAIKEGGDPDR